MKDGTSMRLVANRPELCRLLGLLLIAGLLAAGGCTRAFYRRAADREVNDILAEKDKYGEWRIEQYHVYPDPRARFADPTNPDRPPMPPDDAAAFNLSPHPQSAGHSGVADVEGTGYLEVMKAWDSANRETRKAAEEAAKDAPIGSAGRRGAVQELFDGELSQQQGFVLTLEQSVELGVINSREYQSFREDLYLAALPVTQQRFSFAFQWAATEQAIRNWAGPESLVGHQNDWSLGSNVGFSKLFSTGALLTAAFANNTVFNFLDKGRQFTSVSNINLDLVQPLLRGGGRAVTLEPLTQAERNLVYDIRAYARFREQFYLTVAIGSTLSNNLFTAAGGALGSGPISVLAALGLASTDVSASFSGFLSCLYREENLATDRKYVVDLEKAVKLFEGFQEGGIVAPLQVMQVKSTLLSAQNGVLKDIQDTTNALDQLKLHLGVPVNMPLVLDDTFARPVTRQLDRYYDVLDQADAAYKLVDAQEQTPPEKLRALFVKMFTSDPLVRDTEFQKKITPVWESWAKANDKDIQNRLDKLRAERNKLLDLKTDLELKGQSLQPTDAARLRENEFEADVAGFEQVLRSYEAKPWEKLKDDLARRQERNKRFRLLSYSAQIVLVWARNDRFDEVARLWEPAPSMPLPDESIDLLTADSETAQEAAVRVALRDRVDVLNARAQVVDAWRQLRVTANALMGVLNVQLHLDSTTPPSGATPFAFATSRTHQELTLNGQLPLVRIVERNNYRTALINYQRARRNLMSLEDGIAAQVRFDVRQLHLFSENYKIEQKLIESLYAQVENALEVIVAPVDPDSLKASGTQGQANAASLTSQYLGALGRLNSEQGNIYRIWLSYLATRMQLYVDLERLPLDERGVWIDQPGRNAPEQLLPPQGGPESAGNNDNAGNAVRGAAFGAPVLGGRDDLAPQPAIARPVFLPPTSAAGVEPASHPH
jgi:hypothetical protein